MSRAGFLSSRRAVLRVAGLAAVGAAASRVLAANAGPLVDAAGHGTSPQASPARNLAALRAALAATPVGGTLLIPARGGETYRIDTSGGLARALVIDRPVTVLIEGHIRATHGLAGPDPSYLFDVRADDVRFAGDGALSGPGPADDANDPDDRAHPGLVRVLGDRFSLEGLTISDVPKIGIHLWNCRQATISARWRGGVDHYTRGHTALFGIRATGGGGHRIIGNRFERDERGRRLVTGYFAGGLMGATRGDEITGNIADVHEKLAYLYTSFSRVADCRVVDAMQADCLRLIGSHNVVEGIVADRVRGGVSVYNGTHNTIRNCTFRNVHQAGVFVSFLPDYRGGNAGTSVTGNIIVAADDAGGLQDGICLYLGEGDTGAIVVADNRIEAAGPSVWRNGIRVEAIPPFFAEQPAIMDNVVRGAGNGLSLRRLRGGRVSGNAASRLRGGEPVLWITS